jgi:hypothetical protein
MFSISVAIKPHSFDGDVVLALLIVQLVAFSTGLVHHYYGCLLSHESLLRMMLGNGFLHTPAPQLLCILISPA